MKRRPDAYRLLAAGKGRIVDEGSVCKVWFIVEYKRAAADSKAGLYLPKMCKAGWPAARRLLGKTAAVGARVLAAAGVTYLCTAWSIEQAFLQRGYKAYGGEYLIIPFVFYGTYKAAGAAAWLFRAAGKRLRHRGS